ncbi:putative membrane protein [Streptococcus equinus]|uniref:Putative membrane protein n=1 Tax=Streptococcus equinus TaxID=1335 RepID=A0A1H0NBP8_STREI|nr:YhgE/Pip domain-containing protein [Streptococcus equinus]SDO90097.1 putative membrane protein [Streptococcus equinus]
MLEELKALIKSPKLWVTMIGVALVPALYNLSFLGSMWDPYGNVENLPVAVVNEDKSATLNDKTLTIGDDMVDSMSKNKALDYHFVSQKKADKGLKDGDYYMVITLPEDLSEKASSLLTDNPKKLNIKYQTTAGRSVVASKMSESAMTKLKDTVSENITKTYTKAVFKSMTDLQNGLKKASDGGNQLVDGSQKLESGSQTITDNLNKAASGSQQLADGSTTLVNGLGEYTDGVGQLAPGLDKLSGGVSAYTNGVGQLAAGLPELSAGVTEYTTVEGKVAKVMPQLTQGFNTYAGGVNKTSVGMNALSAGQTTFATALTSYTNGVSQLSAGLTQLNAKSKELTDGINQLQTVSSNNLDQLITGATNLNNGLQALQTELNNTSLPDTSQLQASLNELNQLGQSLSAMSSAISSINSSDLAAVQATSAYQGLSSEQQAEIDAAITNSTGAATANNLVNQISGIQTQLASLQGLSTQLTNLSALLDKVATLKANSSAASAGSQQLVNGLTQFKAGFSDTALSSYASGVSNYTAAVGQVTTGANKIAGNNEMLLSAFSQLNGVASVLQSGLGQLVANSPQLSNGLAQVQFATSALAAKNDKLVNGAKKAENGANQLDAKSDELRNGASDAASGANKLASNNDKLNSGAKKLQSGAQELASGSSKLAAGSGTLTNGLTTLTDGLTTLTSSLSDASHQLSLVSVDSKNAKMVSAPVSTAAKDKDSVKTNGIGMAPYMIAVSLMVVALSTNVIFADSLSGRPVKNRFEWAKQKLFINGLISTAGSVILYAAIQFLGFEANYGWQTLLFIILSGWTLMALVTALVGWDNRYGSFASLIMLLLQVGSAGGSYPIELSPKFFQVVHPYMPMSYIVTGLRQTISMTCSNGKEVAVLTGFLLAFMVLGLVIYRKQDAE